MCTVSSREYKGHLQLKRMIAEHIETTLLCPMYSLEAIEHIHGDTTIYVVAEHDAESRNTSLALYVFMISYTHMWSLHWDFMKIESHALISPRK